MKKWLMVLFTGVSLSVFSQGSDTGRKDTLLRRAPYTLKGSATLSAKDTIVPKLWEQLQEQPVPDYGMPNAITHANRPAPDVYIGNNGKGQDIYRSQLDNMPILKPDSSFSGSMHTGRGYYRKKGAVTVPPGKNFQNIYPQSIPQIRVIPKQRIPKKR